MFGIAIYIRRGVLPIISTIILMTAEVTLTLGADLASGRLYFLYL